MRDDHARSTSPDEPRAPAGASGLNAQVRTASGALKGRGAVSNRAGRFEPWDAEAEDDGWPGDLAEPPAAPRTEFVAETAKSIISTNRSPDISFDRSINPYRGCEHGCVYCFARPSHAFLGLSPGLDFETKITLKPNAAALLEEAFMRAGYQPGTIVLGANTDAYQPAEKRYEIARRILEVMVRFRHPVSIVTKSGLVARDLDLLAPLAEQRLAKVAVSLTTLEPALARTLEPRAASPKRRLQTIESLAKAGVPAVVMTAPVIPALNDHELERLLEAARDAGASAAGYVFLRLPLEIKDLFEEWLAVHAPDRAKRVMGHVYEARGGKAYDARWGERLRGRGPYAALIAARFRKACARLGLSLKSDELRTDLFERPHQPGEQFMLF